MQTNAVALVLAAEAKLAETWEGVVARVERQAEERGRLKAHVRAQRDAAATLEAARKQWESEAAAALAERLTQRDAAASEALALARRQWEEGEAARRKAAVKKAVDTATERTTAAMMGFAEERNGAARAATAAAVVERDSVEARGRIELRLLRSEMAAEAELRVAAERVGRHETEVTGRREMATAAARAASQAEEGRAAAIAAAVAHHVANTAKVEANAVASLSAMERKLEAEAQRSSHLQHELANAADVLRLAAAELARCRGAAAARKREVAMEAARRVDQELKAVEGRAIAAAQLAAGSPRELEMLQRLAAIVAEEEAALAATAKVKEAEQSIGAEALQMAVQEAEARGIAKGRQERETDGASGVPEAEVQLRIDAACAELRTALEQTEEQCRGLARRLAEAQPAKAQAPAATGVFGLRWS